MGQEKKKIKWDKKRKKDKVGQEKKKIKWNKKRKDRGTRKVNIDSGSSKVGSKKRK